MKTAILLTALLALSACTTIRVEAPRGTVTVNSDRNVNTSPSIQADGNTVPVSAVP